jgi:hypothetical protein
METQRSLGEDCLKDEDCLSGICSQLVCAALPPTIDAALFGDGAPAIDAGGDVFAGASEGGSEAAAGESAAPSADVVVTPATDAGQDSSENTPDSVSAADMGTGLVEEEASDEAGDTGDGSPESATDGDGSGE